MVEQLRNVTFFFSCLFQDCVDEPLLILILGQGLEFSRFIGLSPWLRFPLLKEGALGQIDLVRSGRTAGGTVIRFSVEDLTENRVHNY